MITQPTVLVLGAGASMPYGFPSGYSLVRNICYHARRESNWAHDFPQQLREQIPHFIESLERCGQMSIDSFLEHRIDLRECGKFAIARELIPLEVPNRLWAPDIIGSWYQYLFKKMNAPFKEFALNNITFITYNYDRSLEHFLTMSLAYTHNQLPDEAWKVVSQIRIFHVHGALGAYNTSGGNGRPYADTLDSGALQTAARNINIFHEGHEQADVLVNARKALGSASQICFLGFGFDPLTVKRLMPDTWGTGKDILGSCYKMPRLEIGDVRRLIPNIRMDEMDREIDCLGMLHERFRLS